MGLLNIIMGKKWNTIIISTTIRDGKVVVQRIEGIDKEDYFAEEALEMQREYAKKYPNYNVTFIGRAR